MPVSTPRFFLVKTCLNLVTHVSWQCSWVCPLYSEWQSRCPCWWAEHKSHIARASYKQEWFLRGLIVPHRMVFRDGLPAQIWPHQCVCYSPVSVLNCEWKSSVWAHTGAMEEWTLLCENPAVSWRKDTSHHLFHPGSSKATTRHVLWTFGTGLWSIISQMGHSEGKFGSWN